MARTKIQHKVDTAQAHGMPFLKLAFSSGLVLVCFVAMGAGAQNLLKGNVQKQIEAKPNTDLVDRYGDAANDPAVADALRKAQGQQTTEELKETSSAYEALKNGTFKPGANPTMALMNGYVPPNMSPEQAAFLAKHLPKMPRMPHPTTAEDIARMVGEPDTEMTAIEPESPYIPYPESFAKAHGLPRSRRLQMIPQPTFPGQMAGMRGLPNIPGMPMLDSGSGGQYGLNNAEIAAQNQRTAEECVHARFGPVDVKPIQRDPNWLAQHAKRNANGYILESDHQSIIGVCDASGNEITGIQYDPWGNQTVLHGGTVMPAFMYQGMYWHDRSKNYLTLARPYNPALGRFLSRDPFGESAGINLYAYCGNNPINRRDPLGLYVKATYSQSKHTFTAYDTDDPTKVFTSDDMFSGNGSFQNNPMAEGVGGRGPIPQGEYFINNKDRISDAIQGYQYPLNPTSTGTPDFFGMPGAHRGGFEFHPGSRSNGCITFNSKVKEDQPGYPKNPAFDQLSKMLDSTKPLQVNGTSVPGILNVVP